MTIAPDEEDNDESSTLSNDWNHISDRLFDIDVWRSFGRAVRNSTLNTLTLRKPRRGGGVDSNHGERLVAAARCLDALFLEVKHNKSIVKATLINLEGLSVDLSEFILNNKALKSLYLSLEEPVSKEQSLIYPEQ